jgi:hypothetical protein
VSAARFLGSIVGCIAAPSPDVNPIGFGAIGDPALE